MTRALHHLVVALDPKRLEPGHVWSPEHRGCEDCEDDPFTLTVQCPGIEAGGCEAWWECDACRGDLRARGDDDGARDALLDAILSIGAAHGLEHRLIDGELCVPNGHCWVVETSDLDDDFTQIAHVHGPGRHAFEWTGGSWEDAEAHYVAEPTALTTRERLERLAAETGLSLTPAQLDYATALVDNRGLEPAPVLAVTQLWWHAAERFIARVAAFRQWLADTGALQPFETYQAGQTRARRSRMHAQYRARRRRRW